MSIFRLHQVFGCSLDCELLIYDGPLDVHQHVLERTVYMLCSVQRKSTCLPSWDPLRLWPFVILKDFMWGCFEAGKAVGRTTMMVRNTVVSTCDALDDPVFGLMIRWTWLQLETEVACSINTFVISQWA
ncbi:hypothetical protein NPIL_543341 [Nephila pilipes]|uniref:Uncharacterized protein n=1 Tax=Nephila pilipes TaxID=299642 RepID=A0A8X6PXT0_NEPPI|nr:hypothetical protein NPIL_543341 [Nephila pilipes]